MSTRFTRLADPSSYTPTLGSNTDVYQQDRTNGVAISSAKVDLDIVRIIDSLNLIDDDLNSIIAGSLPSQTGNSGKFLTTNGTAASWSLITSTNLSGSNSVLLGTDSSGNGDEISVSSALSLATSTLDLATGGVTTAKIADDAVTLAKMAAGTALRMVGYDASGDPESVAIGTGLSRSAANLAADIASQAEAEAGTSNTKLMTALRTQQHFDALKPTVQLASGTFSASSQIDVTLSSSYTVHRLHIINLSGTVDGVVPWIRIDGNSTAGDYYWNTDGAGGATGVSAASASDTEIEVKDNVGIPTAQNWASFTIEIYSAADASANTMVVFKGGKGRTGTTTGIFMGMGYYTTVEANSVLNLIPSSGTFTGAYVLEGIV